jgi:hypothetical protein
MFFPLLLLLALFFAQTHSASIINSTIFYKNMTTGKIVSMTEYTITMKVGETLTLSNMNITVPATLTHLIPGTMVTCLNAPTGFTINPYSICYIPFTWSDSYCTGGGRGTSWSFSQCPGCWNNRWEIWTNFCDQLSYELVNYYIGIDGSQIGTNTVLQLQSSLGTLHPPFTEEDSSLFTVPNSNFTCLITEVVLDQITDDINYNLGGLVYLFGDPYPQNAENGLPAHPIGTNFNDGTMNSFAGWVD